jgi:hypothetical protein
LAMKYRLPGRAARQSCASEESRDLENEPLARSTARAAAAPLGDVRVDVKRAIVASRLSSARIRRSLRSRSSGWKDMCTSSSQGRSLVSKVRSDAMAQLGWPVSLAPAMTLEGRRRRTVLLRVRRLVLRKRRAALRRSCVRLLLWEILPT